MPSQTLRVSTGLKLKTNLRGVMKLHQALKILSMPAADLRETVQGYLASNPILEEEQKQEQQQEHYPHEHIEFPTKPRIADEILSEEQIKSHDKTIRDILLEEPQLAFDDPKKSEIKDYLIGNIDDNGYLLCTIHEAAQRLGCEDVDAEEVLKFIQDNAPAGVGARTPQEALLLQLKRDLEDEELRIGEAIVNEHWQSLRKRRFGEVANILDTTPEMLYQVWEKLSRYTFSPGANYAPKAEYVTPEISIRLLGDQIQIQPLKDGIPNITINQEYSHILKATDDEDTANYLREKMFEAKWLIRAIELRRQNILRIVTEVARVQSEFFTQNNATIKPLTLKDVAERLHLSPSTVSRAINSKYVLTPQGTFQLKYFFTGGFNNGKTRISTIAVKDAVKEICVDGDYTDKKIADMIIKRLGIKLSRRAVTQYRQEMSIPSSVDRRKKNKE